MAKTKMTEANLAAAKRILDIQKAKDAAPSWGVAEHCTCVADRLWAVLEAEGIADKDDADTRKGTKKLLRDALLLDGLGGNSSQFRQKLVDLELLPKSATADAADPYADA